MILLDTHAFIWLASDPAKLSQAARRAITENAAQLHVSAVTAWEISLLVRRGRLALPMTPEEFVERAVQRHALVEIPVTRAAAQASVALPPLHNDPFDRLLVAECGMRRLALVSADRTIALYPNIRIIW